MPVQLFSKLWTYLAECSCLFTVSCTCTSSAKILTRRLSRQRSTGTPSQQNILSTHMVTGQPVFYVRSRGMSILWKMVHLEFAHWYQRKSSSVHFTSAITDLARPYLCRLARCSLTWQSRIENWLPDNRSLLWFIIIEANPSVHCTVLSAAVKSDHSADVQTMYM